MAEANKNLRLADDIAQRHAGVIDFERLAGAMLPAHRRRPGVSLPGMEIATAVAVRKTSSRRGFAAG